MELYYYEQPEINDMLIDYNCAKWGDEACVWVERRVRVEPVPESFSVDPPLMNDRQLVDSPKNDLL